MAASSGCQANHTTLRKTSTQKGEAGRPLRVGPGCRERWKVERTFAWLGNFRRLLVRQERHLSTFRAFFLVAFVLISLRQF
jgi:hypothetical protein